VHDLFEQILVHSLQDEAIARSGSRDGSRTGPKAPESMIRSDVIPVVRLSEVFRQAAASRIIVNAHRINAGEIPDLRKPEGDSDFYFVPADDPETAVPRIIELVQTRIPGRFGFNSVRDIQVLCPMNRGGVGARSLNIELQKALNPVTDRKVERFGWTFAAGDKVVQIENDYDKEVYNGDIGFVEDVDPEGSELTAIFDGRAVTYGFGELDALVLAYAATIHKSQGSEYPVVVIPVMMQHYMMLQRNLLYTGVTRGKRLVVLVGQKKAVAIAVRNVSGRRRWSKLNKWPRKWENRDYYGTIRHNAKAIYQKYLGWYDGNPANLDPLPPVEAAKKYVAYMGGADAVIRHAREDFKNGEYRFVAEVANKLVFADPANQEARELAADANEQLGYLSESATWRNAYLYAAYELRHGAAKLGRGPAINPNTINAIPTDVVRSVGGAAERAESRRQTYRHQLEFHRRPTALRPHP
jgi:hypothetical protein